MVIASELRSGMVLRIQGEIYKVLEVESRAGAAKMSGVVKTKLSKVKTGGLWEPHFRPQERLDEVELERHMMEFLFADAESCTFMRPDTYEQIEIPNNLTGPARLFLQSGMEVPVEFFAGQPISVVFPEAAEVRVASTTPAVHAPQDSAWKEAALENGMSIRVPLFIGPGEVVRIDVKTGKYMERARAEHKRSA
ncbi:MAG TPA: elongation factor P [Terriglobales bacterium]|jgi:elongation factor P|nr:elongation factor P [Terriglobales bacterium]